MLPDSVTVVLFVIVLYALMFEIKRLVDRRTASNPPAEKAADHDHAEHQ